MPDSTPVEVAASSAGSLELEVAAGPLVVGIEAGSITLTAQVADATAVTPQVEEAV